MVLGLNRTSAIGIVLIILSFLREILGALADVQGGLSALQSVGVLNFLGSPLFRLLVLVCGLGFVYLGYRKPGAHTDIRVEKARHVFEFQLIGCFRAYASVIQSDLLAVEQRGAPGDKVPLRLVWSLVNEKSRSLRDLLSNLKAIKDYNEGKEILLN